MKSSRKQIPSGSSAARKKNTMELENVNEVMVKRRRNEYRDELHIEDLRHESLNQILKQNMEILKHVDTAFGGSSVTAGDDDDLDNNSLSGESLLNGVDVSVSCCDPSSIAATGDSNNNDHHHHHHRLHEILASSATVSDNNSEKMHGTAADDDAVFNQLIDDERNSVNGDDDVSLTKEVLYRTKKAISLAYIN